MMGTLQVGGALTGLGAQRPVGRLPGGGHVWGLLDRRRVGPATWFPPPTPAGEPGFLWGELQ